MRILGNELQRLGSSVQNPRNGIGDFFPHEPTIFAQHIGGTKFTVNITDDFDKPHTFDQVVALLSTAGEEDEIIFNINSGGGYVDSLNMLLGWKAMCKARQVHVLMGNASSAASAFFLSKADQYIVGEGATMMIHEFQAGTYGTQSNNNRRNSHTQKQCEKFVRATYAAFLSEKEIEDVLSGVEIYLDAEEVTQRLALRLKAIAAEKVPLDNVDVDEELKHFKEYLSGLSREEVEQELEDMLKFHELAKEALAKFTTLE